RRRPRAARADRRESLEQRRPLHGGSRPHRRARRAGGRACAGLGPRHRHRHRGGHADARTRGGSARPGRERPPRRAWPRRGGRRAVVRLPLAAAPSAARPAAERKGASPATRLRLPKILIVDDDRDAAVTLGMILKSFGAETEIACSGPEALEKFAACSPTIVFLDIGMPLMDGYEVARRIRKNYPEQRPTLVALTGWGQREDRRKAREAGFDHHIVEPADIGVLRELVSSVSERSTSVVA